MGFLSGVLGAVKDDDAVTTYDNYIENSENKLNNVLEKLTKNIGSGREGLAASVDAVKGWLEGYGKSVNEKTENVKNVIKTLDNDIPTVITEFEKLKNKDYSDDVLRSWLQSTRTLSSSANYASDLLVYLDDNLKMKLTPTVDMIKQAVVTFRSNAKRDRQELEEFGWKIADEITKLQNQVIPYAERKGEECISILRKEFSSKINWPIFRVAEALEKAHGELGRWIQEAQGVLAGAIGTIENVHGALDHKTGPSELKNKIDAINEIKNSVNRIHGRITGIDMNLQEWIKTAMPIVSDSLTLVKDILEEIDNKRNNPTNIKLACEKLNEDAKRLFNATTQAHDYITAQVSAASDAVKRTLKEAVETDMRSLRNAIRRTVGGYAQTLPNVIKSKLTLETNTIYNKHLNDGHLNKIVKGIREYAERFSKGGSKEFEKIVGEWIDVILEDDGVVNHRLGIYVSSNTSYGHFGHSTKYTDASSLRAPMREQIVNELRSKIMPATERLFVVAQEENLEIKSNIKRVKDGIHTFVQMLSGELKKEKLAKRNENIIDKIVNGIALKIEQGGAKTVNPLRNHNLERAVESTLTALLSAARQVENELGSFTGQNGDDSEFDLGTNLEDTIKKVDSLWENLEKTLQAENALGVGTKGDTFADALEKAFNKKVDTTYGGEHDGVQNSSDPFSTFNGPNGTQRIMRPLDLIKGEDGLKRMKDIKSCDNKTDGNISLNSLKGLYNTVHTSLKSLIDLIKEKAGKNSDHDGLKQKLDKLQKLLGVETNIPIGRDAQCGLRHIQQNLNKETTELGGQPGKMLTVVEAIQVELATLRKMLKKELNGQDGVVDKLKSFLDTSINSDHGNNKTNETPGLQKIMTDIATILGISTTKHDPNNLRNIVEETKTFHTTMQHRVNACISAINAKVKQEVTDKIKNLKKSALTQFTNRKTAELEALKTLVSTQISAIETIIRTDSASGLKGLLKALYASHYPIPTASRHSVTDLSAEFRNYLMPVFSHISTEVPSPSSQLVAGLQTRTHDLLSHLHDNKRTFTFDSGFRSRLHGLTSALSTFDPATFANPQHPQLLDALKAGMQGLVKEMEKAYVNRYDSEKIKWSETTDAEFKPTADAKRCAKVFMSCLPMLLNDLSKVKERCVERGEWSKKHLHIDHEVQDARKRKNPLGTFFRDCGYIVPTSQTSKQDGELQCRHGFNGAKILEKLLEIKVSVPDQIKHIKECESNKHPLTGAQVKSENFDVYDIMSCLFGHLHEYYTVHHYATFTASKHPSTICDMLQWLTGLPHSPVYNALSHDGFSGLFEKKDEDENKGTLIGDILLKTDDDDKLPAYPEDITANNMRGILALVCHHAEETLISFLGHGHSGGTYACDFNTNTAKLTYPSDPSKCLDLLFEVIGRVYNQLFFLFKQCSYSTKLGGWYDCWYGQGVGGSAWNCNTLQCPGQSADQKTDQMHNQKCKQSCDLSAECGLKSPLQSFLEDGLPGFLPHPYSKSDCKPTCSAPGHFGKVCITPMGFNDISGMASRRQQGRHIMDVLREFCGSEHAPLSRLCGLLTCLLTRPPQTLGDMFAFYYNFLNGWNPTKLHVIREKHREIAYNMAVEDANFKSTDNPLDVSSMFKSVKHNSKSDSTHHKGDLFSLVACDQAMAKDTYCGRYLQPCGQHIWTVFSKEHASNYLSWIVYLTETFYDLLEMLYDDCNNKCGQEHSKCNRTSCAVGCPTKSSSESGTSSQIKFHDSKCSTIVTCKSSLPTFCRYGFVFDSPQSLSGEYGDDKKRTCKDFCKALANVLNINEKDEHVLAKLIYVTIPEFLFKIRQPFIWLNVALWLLSLFYLICVMVGRLDVLHIRSHLRIPSSHKITAQSLLAAAQVGRLAKISYLQP